MKSCKRCKGKGFTFDGTSYKEKGWYLYLVNVKETCKKCYGKGVR